MSIRDRNEREKEQRIYRDSTSIQNNLMVNTIPRKDIEKRLNSTQGSIMGKDLTYDDLEQIITDLKSEIAHYKTNETSARAIFDEFMQVTKRLQCGIYRFDIKLRRFIFFNRVAIELLGSNELAESEITSKSILLRIHPEDREMVRQAVKKSMAPGIDSGEAEYRYRKSDGTYRWTYDRWVVLRDCSEQPCYIEGIIMDITERKKAEKALKESEQKLRLLSSYLMKA